MKTYSYIIVDDEYVDSLWIRAMAKRFPFLDFQGSFNNTEDALRFIKEKTPDILFTDIDMPGDSGLQLRKMAMNIPACIFVTSYPEYAIESFSLDVLDYLIKPVSTARFDEAMHRLIAYLELRHKAELYDYNIGGDSIFIKEGNKQIKINLYEIDYLEALKNYTIIYADGKKHCVLNTLNIMLEKPELKSFIRIHRSYAVLPQKVTGINKSDVYIEAIKLPIGRSYKHDVEEALMKTG